MEEKADKGIRKKLILLGISTVILIVLIVLIFITNSQTLKLYNSKVEIGDSDYIANLTKEENIYIKEGYTFSIKDNNIDINKLGTYEVVFEIKGEGKITTETKKIQVVDTIPPTITLKRDTIYVGDNVNIEELVSITDNSIEEEISYSEANGKLEGDIDTSKEGEVIFRISVSDKNGNKGTQTLTVNVKNPIISKYDYITEKLRNSKEYSIGDEENKFVIYYENSKGERKGRYGWINFTDKVEHRYSERTYGTVAKILDGDLKYFDDSYNVTRHQNGTSFYRDYSMFLSANKAYLKEMEVTSNSKINIDAIKKELNDTEGKIVLVNKTTEDLKNETIDLREL